MNALTISGRRILAVGALAATVVAFGPTAQAVSGRPGTAVPAVRDSVHTPSANQSVRTLAGGGLAAATIGNAPNCVLSGTTRTCSVYGKTGSWTAGGVTFPVWGFSPSSAAAATIPGPTLTATVGENLVMRLYNRLPGAVGPLGLEVPGLTGFQSDVTGIAASTTPKNYQAVTLTTPGTYVYQASPTSNGAREVAMGMSGVLIVRPAGYDANDPTKRTAYGNPTGVPTAPDAFDSESLVVLNEFDLSFSAGSVSAVNNRDLTNYTPKVFLINGKAFNPALPAANQIPVAAGDKLLLRYADLGLRERSVGILGLRQNVAASQSRSLLYAPNPSGVPTDPPVVVPMHNTQNLYLNPGETTDTLSLVDPAATVGQSYPLMDAGLHLNNSGAAGLGGMLSMITVTTGPAGSPNGPSVEVHVAPQDYDGNAIAGTGGVGLQIRGRATAKAGHTLGASNDAEWFLDQIGDPGTGFAFTYGSTGYLNPDVMAGDLNAALALTGAQNGDHVIWVRAKDANGTWGLPSGDSVTVNLDGPLASAIAMDPNPTNGTNRATKVNLDPSWGLTPGPGDVVLTGTGMASLPGWAVLEAQWCRAADVVAVDNANPEGCTNVHTIPLHPDPATDGAAAIVALATVIDKTTVASFGEGATTIRVRLHEARPDVSAPSGFEPGRWSAWNVPGASEQLTVDTAGPATTGVAVHPAPNNGFQGDSGNLGFLDSLKVTANVSDATNGGSNIVDAEAFITGTKHGVADATPLTDPGSPDFTEGTGAQMMAVGGLMGKTSNQDIVGFLPLAEIRAYDEGDVTIWVRGKDDAGQWGPFASATFTLDKTAPIISTATLTPNGGGYDLTFTANDPGTVNTNVTAAEWFVAPCVPADPEISCFNDPGNGNANPIAPFAAGSPVTETDQITVPADPGGNPQALWVRVRDAAGNWSDPFKIGPPLQ